MNQETNPQLKELLELFDKEFGTLSIERNGKQIAWLNETGVLKDFVTKSFNKGQKEAYQHALDIVKDNHSSKTRKMLTELLNRPK